MGYLEQNEALQEKVNALNFAAAAIGNIAYLPALNSQKVPEWLEEFLTDAHPDEIKRLNTSWPEMQAVYDSFEDCGIRDRAGFMQEFAIDLKRTCGSAFFVEVLLCCGIYSVDLNEAGEVIGNSTSWNSYYSTAVFAMSMEDAVEQATALGMANLKAWHEKNHEAV